MWDGTMLRLFATYTIVEVVEHSQDLELLVNADDWQTCCGSSLADIFLMLTPIFQIPNPNLSAAQPCASEAQPYPETRASVAQPHQSPLLAESADSADSADMYIVLGMLNLVLRMLNPVVRMLNPVLWILNPVLSGVNGRFLRPLGIPWGRSGRYFALFLGVLCFGFLPYIHTYILIPPGSEVADFSFHLHT